MFRTTNEPLLREQRHSGRLAVSISALMAMRLSMVQNKLAFFNSFHSPVVQVLVCYHTASCC